MIHRETKLVAAMTIILVYFVVEIVFGYMTGSLALVADSFHMLSDFLALAIALYAINLGKKTERSSQSVSFYLFALTCLL